MTPPVPTADELRFYYFGFYAVLKRYRFMTLLGWLVVAVGLVSFMLAWNVGREHGIIDTMLACGCASAGLALVQNSVASLSSYVSVPFRSTVGPTGSTEQVPAVREIVVLMKGVEEGGWQDAYMAIRKLKELESTYGLPSLNR
jgi:hypothetical protein